jgi:hypothetical protein
MIQHSIDGSTIHIETDAIKADIRTEGYTSGVAAGTFVDKKTGARDVGFGLSIVDFLLEPADPDRPTEAGQYEYRGKFAGVHGDIPKRYVEGPQICTQAKKLPFEVVEGDGFLVVRQWFTWHQGFAPHRAGSRWEQTLVFPESTRYFFSSDRVTTVNECKELFFRVDMPGHIKHKNGDTFEHVYLSYDTEARRASEAAPSLARRATVPIELTIPSTDFMADFPPDGRNLYQRGRHPMPDRFIRAYQVKSEGKPGAWLAGMTLEPADVYEAWCHQRGYVCLIEELGGWPTKPGDTLGAAYIVGWFDSVAEMRAAYDRHRGWSGLELKGDTKRPTAFVGVKQKNLVPVTRKS